MSLQDAKLKMMREFFKLIETGVFATTRVLTEAFGDLNDREKLLIRGACHAVSRSLWDSAEGLALVKVAQTENQLIEAIQNMTVQIREASRKGDDETGL